MKGGKNSNKEYQKYKDKNVFGQENQKKNFDNFVP